MTIWNNLQSKVYMGLQNRVFYSNLLNAWTGLNIYIPKAYHAGNERYPVVYWLHGEGGDETTGIFLAEFLNGALQEENIPPFIMVFANGGQNALYEDSSEGDGMIESYLIEELIPFVDRNYRTIASREGRALEGVLAGGTGALGMALKHPELFSSVRSFSAKPAGNLPDIGGLLHSVSPKNKGLLWKELQVKIILPDQDKDILGYNLNLHHLLGEHGLPHCFELLEGFTSDVRTYYDCMGHGTFNYHFRQPVVQPYRYELLEKENGTQVHRNVEYARIDGFSLLLDLYIPTEAKGPLPVVIYLFGGAFRYGSKNCCMAERLTGNGYAVASVEYRLTGEAVFPAQIIDCKAAVRWLRANAGKYGLDPERIGVWGASAGGYLAIMLGTTGDTRKFDVDGGNLEYSSRVQAVCDFYGPTDMLKMDSYFGTFSHDAPQSAESRLLGGPIQKYRERAENANPIGYISKNVPPFLIVHDRNDMYVPYNQGQLLYNSLKAVNGDVFMHTAREKDYPFHGYDDSGEERTEMKKAVDDFFDRYLKNK